MPSIIKIYKENKEAYDNHLVPEPPLVKSFVYTGIKPNELYNLHPELKSDKPET